MQIVTVHVLYALFTHSVPLVPLFTPYHRRIHTLRYVFRYSRVASHLFTYAVSFIYTCILRIYDAFTRLYRHLPSLTYFVPAYKVHSQTTRILYAFDAFQCIYLWSAHASVCIAAYDCIHAPSMHAHACGRIHHSCMQTASRL